MRWRYSMALDAWSARSGEHVLIVRRRRIGDGLFQARTERYELRGTWWPGRAIAEDVWNAGDAMGTFGTLAEAKAFARGWAS